MFRGINLLVRYFPSFCRSQVVDLFRPWPRNIVLLRLTENSEIYVQKNAKGFVAKEMEVGCNGGREREGRPYRRETFSRSGVSNE
ncbi:hypothetical protein OUZ56_013803 [Daphnia magna]|uniref:Uncharacterized protein n=1 Tax=Daphnia magna TaxID=35525 RepID=A0ABQ9Z6Z9_9CRUS|nr:hypothetical protein OUZ56_013803 [Daphnia magna]